MVFIGVDKEVKQVILNCNCGCEEQISIKKYLWESDLPSYSLSISTANYYSGQRGIFKTILNRLKLCWLALRGKEYRLTELELNQEEITQLIDNLIEIKNSQRTI